MWDKQCITRWRGRYGVKSQHWSLYELPAADTALFTSTCIVYENTNWPSRLKPRNTWLHTDISIITLITIIIIIISSSSSSRHHSILSPTCSECHVVCLSFFLSLPLLFDLSVIPNTSIISLSSAVLRIWLKRFSFFSIIYWTMYPVTPIPVNDSSFIIFWWHFIFRIHIKHFIRNSFSLSLSCFLNVQVSAAHVKTLIRHTHI